LLEVVIESGKFDAAAYSRIRSRSIRMESQITIRRFTRRGTLLLMLLSALFIFGSVTDASATASPEVKLTAEEQLWLDNHPGLKIGIRETPPLVMAGKTGEGYQGLSIDYVNRVEKLLGIRFNLVHYPSWQKLIDETKNRNVDIIVTGTITLDRASFMDFSPPYIQLHNKIIVKKELDTVQYKLSEMSGLKVAAVEDTAVYNFIKKSYPEVKLVPVRDEISALESVSFGETHAAVMEMARATYYIEQEKITNLTIGGDAGYLYNFCFASRNDWHELKSILSKALSCISEKERAEITAKWLHISNDSIFQSRTFWIYAGITFGVTSILLIIFWNIALRQKVTKSTAAMSQEMEQLARAESELRRLNRTLMVLGKSHELLMQFTEEMSLYNAICKHLVEVGGYKTASVVLNEGKNGSVVAGYCRNDSGSGGYLVSSTVNIASSTANKAIKSEAVTIERSVVAIPLWGEGIVIGALGISSIDETDFDEEEVALLTELAENMAYSVVAIRLKEEHREAEELVRKLSQAVEQSPVTIVITDRNGTIEYVNPCFTKITGYTAQEAVGQNPRMLKSGVQNSEFYRTLWDLVSGGFEWHGELCNKKKNGEVYWESASISPVRNSDGEITHYVAVKEDITDQKHAYEELQRAKAEAEAATTAKSSFLANMSHEIRTPMNAVIGMLYLVQQSELCDKQKSYIMKAEGAAKSLLKIINDILDFSKIEAGRLQMEIIPFLLSEVITKITDIAPVNIGNKKVDLVISISPDTPDFLNGDPLRLGQILLNLVSNAIKFTEKGTVLVSISIDSMSDDKVRIRFCVEDSGIGMTTEQKGKLFGAFSQADSSTTRRFGGTGLGLTISKQLVELMGGEISVDSEEGIGSRFTFSVNFSLEDGHNEPLSESFQALKDLRILHICNTSKGCLATGEMLSSFGVITSSMTPSEVSCIKEPEYDLILYDVSITDKENIKDFFEASCIKPLESIPSLIFTSDRKLTGVDSSCSQVSSIVVKPTSPTHLLYAIMNAAGLSERQEMEEEAVIAVEGYFKGRRMLLAEDNEINQEVAKEILERWGIELDIAANGAVALQMISSSDSIYDAILMDLQMPVMDGFGATRLIRSDEKYKDLPIIAMTASALTSDRELCIAAGMNDHVAKPIDVAELFSTLHRWFRPESELPETLLAEVAESEKKGIQFPDDTPGIDLDKAMKRLGSQQILITVLREFRRLHTKDDKIIRDALEKGSTLMAKRVAHTLKGLARTVGAEDAGSAAASIEAALAQGNSEDISPLVNDLSEKLELLNRTLGFIDSIPHDDFLSVTERDKADAAGSEMIAEMLKKLSQQLGKNNLDACTTFRKLKQLLVSDTVNTHMKKLELGVESLNFREAKVTLDNIAEILNINLEQESYS
jgi:polar amino acid transport system substrate-binding protein